jgi:hypothetical protein
VGFESRHGARSLSCPKCTERLWDPPSFVVSGYCGSFPGVKRPGLCIDHSSPSGAEVKNEWGQACTSPIYLHGVDRDNFAFLYFYPVCRFFFFKGAMLLMCIKGVEFDVKFADSILRRLSNPGIRTPKHISLST